MHHPTHPVRWRDIAAVYDPRGLPFWRYYVEAGMTENRRGRKRDRS